MNEERLDKLLVQRKLVETRVAAEKMIKEIGVKVDGKLISKTGKKFPVECSIEIIEKEIPWVSMDALKIIEALEKWNPSIENGVFLDIGASVGGFSDVLLKKGAAKVYAVDMLENQLHPTLLSNTNVVNLEKTHVRELTTSVITEPIDGCVVDVSFVSLENIFPFIQAYIKPGGFIIAVVKPQFEVGKKNVDKMGTVKDKKLYKDVKRNVKHQATLANFSYVEDIPSPILGENSNQEFLMYLTKK